MATRVILLIVVASLLSAFKPVDDMVRSSSTVVAGAVALAAMIGAILALSITRPLRRLRASAEAIAAGDLAQRTGLSGHDELGELGSAFDHMADRLQQTLAELRQRDTERAELAAIVQSSDDAIIGMNLNGVVTSWNAGAERLYGYVASNMIGQPIARIIPSECSAEYTTVIRRLMHGERIQQFETIRLHEDGRRVDVALTVSVVLDARGLISGVAIIAREITERKRAEAILLHQAWNDALTNLPNRARLQDELQRLTAADTDPRPQFALLLLDLDRFKDVNDTLGHHCGDLLLRQVGPRFLAELPGSAMLARLGGDEFAVLLPDTSAQVAGEIASRLLGALERPFDLEGSAVEIGGSIGIALYPDAALDADTLLRRADVAMYAAKGARSGYAIYSADQDRYSPERLALVADLRHAIEIDELALYYQPQVDVQTGALVAVEALVRWPHPEHGLMSPDQFVPLAEERRLIRPLSRWVLRTALTQCATWRAAGLDLTVAVNLSAHDLQDSTLPEEVGKLLESSGVPAERLRLEITESSLMIDPAGAREILVRLRTLGLRIAIDDFGTGYSSLEYLRNLPVDELKIDRSFVSDMATDPGARAIVRAIIDLGDDLGLRVVAEGIEDQSTWEVLAALGCDLAQGYYFGAPMPAADLGQWLTDAERWQRRGTVRQEIEAALEERSHQRGSRLAAEEQFIARKHAEEALRESEERLRLAVEAAGMATWDWEVVADRMTWSGNTATLFGLASADLAGGSTQFLDRVHADDRAGAAAALAEAVQHGGELPIECRIVQPDGSLRGLACSGRVVHDVAGRPVRVLGTAMDITARQEAERQREALVQAEKLRALSQLARGVAHDVNQSLLLIAGYGEIVRKALLQPEIETEELQETWPSSPARPWTRARR